MVDGAQPQGKPAADTKGLWALEASLDVQWAHAIAPGAKIMLVQAKSNAFMDLMGDGGLHPQAAKNKLTVVSMSSGAQEFSTETRYDHYFTTPAGHAGVTFVARLRATMARRGSGLAYPLMLFRLAARP